MIWWAKQQLKSKDPKARERAVEKLLAEGGDRACEALISVLNDSDVRVRRMAATTLGELREEGAVKPLANALRDSDEGVRAMAAKSLGRIRVPDAEISLIAALADPATAVRWQAARALNEWNWQPPTPAQRALFFVAQGKLDLAANLGADAIDAITMVLRSGAYQERQAAVVALGHIPDARVQKALVTALSDREDQVRCAAVEALGHLGDRAVAPSLITLLRDQAKNVRAAVAERLGHLGNPQAIEPLRTALNDKSWEVRQAAVLSLGRLRDVASLEQMIALLGDYEHEVRETTCRALEVLGEKRAITPLVGMLKDEKANVRQRAMGALVGLDKSWWQTEAARAAAPQLQAVLQHNDYWVRQSAADALARITHTQAAELRGVPASQPSIAAPLHFRRQAAVEALTALLWDFDPELRVAAADALGRIGQTTVLPALIHSANDTDSRVQAAAARAVMALKALQSQAGGQPAGTEIFPY